MKQIAGYLMSPPAPTDVCDCSPPTPGAGRMTLEPCGTVWLCEHKQRGWEVFNAPAGRVGREWRELTGGRLRRAQRKLARHGYLETTRETWEPATQRPTLPPPVEPSR